MCEHAEVGSRLAGCPRCVAAALEEPRGCPWSAGAICVCRGEVTMTIASRGPLLLPGVWGRDGGRARSPAGREKALCSSASLIGEIKAPHAAPRPLLAAVGHTGHPWGCPTSEDAPAGCAGAGHEHHTGRLGLKNGENGQGETEAPGTGLHGSPGRGHAAGLRFSSTSPSCGMGEQTENHFGPT